MCSQLIQTVNISLEICANVFTADPNCEYFIGNMCKCVHSWSKLLIFHWKYVQMCSQLIQTVNISFEICANVFTADPNCQYFIGNMCKCVNRWSGHGGGHPVQPFSAADSASTLQNPLGPLQGKLDWGIYIYIYMDINMYMYM